MTAAVKRAIRRLDTAIGRAAGPRRVLADIRNQMHCAVLEPITRAFARDPRVELFYTAERLSVVAAAFEGIPSDRIITHQDAALRRWDLYISADPWTRPALRRCARCANVFHGVAGKYDLDDPSHLPIRFQDFDRVLFINRDRMARYLAKGVVSERQAVLVGFPKVDPLVNGAFDGEAVRRSLGLDSSRPTALYAPTWSAASSLNLAGEAIIAALAGGGCNVIVKLHPLSLDREVTKYSGGIDWRARLNAVVEPGRIVHVEDPDASPYLAASDVMVTDHSTIGFEFFLLDRPLIVFDVPQLIETARINPEKVRELRRAAQVVDTIAGLSGALRDALAHPERLSSERRALAAAMFFEPGGATARAIAAAYDLIDLAPAAEWSNRDLCPTSMPAAPTLRRPSPSASA
jgi:CDP-glycerol:poly(glycerophosphate) glycerophosphotransferase